MRPASGSASSPDATGAAGAADAAGPAGAAGPPPVSIVMIGVPTSTMVPASNSSSVTVPAYGEGSSTAAFAVSTSQSGWLTVTVSPTATSHCRISPSVSPSPTSGSLNWRSVALDVMAQNPIDRSTASSTRSRSGRYSSSSFDGGYGVSYPPTRSTGASREWKQVSVTRAAISAPRPRVTGASWTTTQRPVRRTDWNTGSRSSGEMVRRSTTSSDRPSSAAASAAWSAVFTIGP